MNLSDVISLPQLLHREARCHAAHQCRYNCWEAFSQSTLFSVPACMYEFKMRSFFCMKKKNHSDTELLLIFRGKTQIA